MRTYRPSHPEGARPHLARIEKGRFKYHLGRVKPCIKNKDLSTVLYPVGAPARVAGPGVNRDARNGIQEFRNAFPGTPQEYDPCRALFEEELADRQEFTRDRLLQAFGKLLHELRQPLVET